MENKWLETVCVGNTSVVENRIGIQEKPTVIAVGFKNQYVKFDTKF